MDLADRDESMKMNLLKRARGYLASEHYSSALSVLKQKELQDDPAARALLGTCYLVGEGVEKDVKIAMDHLKYAAKMGHASAQRTVGSFYVPKNAEGSYRKTEKWWTRAAVQGDVLAQEHLGFYYRNDFGSNSEDLALSIHWFTKATTKHSVRAQYALGCAYKSGKGVPRDYAKAFEWIFLAASGGSSKAQNMVGEFYLQGCSVEQDYKKAVYWFERSAERKNAAAQNNLGVLYRHGLGVEKSTEKAFEYFAAAALQKQKSALYNAGMCWKLGQGTDADPSAAFRCFAASDSRELPSATTQLALCYKHGLGTGKDPKKALDLFIKASATGDPYGQYNLGLSFFVGYGGIQADTGGFKWMLASAKQGYGDAQFKIAECYSVGLGTEIDHDIALDWLVKAVRSGVSEAGGYVSKYVSNMRKASMPPYIPAPKRECSFCGVTSKIPVQCRQCRILFYCGPECRLDHWLVGEHSAKCASLKASMKNSCSCCWIPIPDDSILCAGCFEARYCSKQCLRLHWSAHKLVCSYKKK
jgi:TPR repeat protein